MWAKHGTLLQNPHHSHMGSPYWTHIETHLGSIWVQHGLLAGWLNPGSRGRTTRTNGEKAGDYVVPNVLSPRDLVSRPDKMDETVLSSIPRAGWPWLQMISALCMLVLKKNSFAFVLCLCISHV